MAGTVTKTYTYNSPNTTNRDKVRRHIQDVDMSDARWTDEEIADYLTDCSSNIFLTCSKLLATEATDAARVANIIRLGTFGDNEQTVYAALVERSKYFEMRSGAGYAIDPPDRIFTTDKDDGATVGTMTGW